MHIKVGELCDGYIAGAGVPLLVYISDLTSTATNGRTIFAHAPTVVAQQNSQMGARWACWAVFVLKGESALHKAN